MALQAIAFYILAAAVLGAGLMVITARNPVHAVLFLIAAFFAAAGLFVLMGAEFLAMILVVVYVGAVAVLFLFVVMMLDVDFDQLRAGFTRYLPVGAVVALVLVGEMAAVSIAVANRGAAAGSSMMTPSSVTNAEAIGRVLYTDYVYFFQAAGMILLVAMIGAIVLTLRHRPYVRRQSVLDQTARSARTGMRLVSIKSGEGIAE
ncbi:MAG TPA: NADH-quinone oxidoreductase subunit J [Caulobacteraceae bacterium]|nr:NADH-quinone oxidoreductase subunit J [Caulobacteraceae bacterium]